MLNFFSLLAVCVYAVVCGAQRTASRVSSYLLLWALGGSQHQVHRVRECSLTGRLIFLAFVYLDEGSHIALAAVRSMEPRITLKYFFARGKG